MKNACYTGLILFLFAVNSCKQKDVQPDYYINATVGSETFRFEGNTYLASSSGSYKSTFIVAAYPDATKELVFTTTAPLTSGSGTLIISYASYRDGTGKNYTGGSGTCTITKFDGKVVEGTFQFDTYFYLNAVTAPEILTVKSGRFRLKYT